MTDMHVTGTCWDCVHGYGVLNPPCCVWKNDPSERCHNYEQRKEMERNVRLH